MDKLYICKSILDLMIKKGKTVCTAESCTSGRIAASLTMISGASDYFQGGLVAYQDEWKIKYLGVSQSDIKKYNVVSRQVLEQMVIGACEFFSADYALASTGYAGRGTSDIPDGTIWIGWGNKDDVHSLLLSHDNGRESNTENATNKVLEEFLKYLHNLE